MSRTHAPSIPDPLRDPSARTLTANVTEASDPPCGNLALEPATKNLAHAASPPPAHAVGRVAVDELMLFPGNPRRGSVKGIADSLRRHGQLRPAVVNRRNNQVLVGNHMLRAARSLGWGEIAVIWVDLDDDAARRLVLLDNRLSDVATYDVDQLLAMLSSVDDLEGTGYEQTDLDELLDGLAPPPLDEDELIPLPAEPVTQPGEVIELGEHVLVCSDARDPHTYEPLLGCWARRSRR